MTLVQAFISCRLDYCNSLFYCITEGLMSRLQSVQIAGLVLGTRHYDHITPVLQQLHWLLVRRRVDFKMVTLVYLSLSGMAPAYLPPTVSWTLSAAFCHVKDVCCETILQQLWRQVFCSCRSEAVEQPSS